MANNVTNKFSYGGNDYIIDTIHAIVGTQTASTNAWTGKIDVPALYDGLVIAYFLPYAGTSTAATLNLTLSGGGTTGAVNVYYANNTRATTHYGVGSTIILTYWSAGSIKINGTATTDNRWTSFDYYTNTYDRTYINTYIKAATATTAGYLLCGTDAGYKNLAKNVAFDITYPMLYEGTAIAANGTRADGYIQIPVNLTTTNGGTSPAFTTYKMVFVKGVLSGTTFTVDSNTLFTQTIPTSADGKHYYLLGIAGSATNIFLQPQHLIYEYSGGSFHEVAQNAKQADGVIQTATSDSNNYEVLFSGTADNTTRAEETRKTSTLLFNPSTNTLTLNSWTIAVDSSGNMTILPA